MGQSIDDALAKELWQETGLIMSKKPKLISIDFNSDVSERDHVLTYLCETKGEIFSRKDDLEIAELGYFRLNDYPDDTHKSVIQILNKLVSENEIKK